MKQLVFIVIWLWALNSVQAQVCATQQLDVRSPAIIEQVERDLATANFEHQRSVTYIQTVVHVLWNTTTYDLSDSVVQANIDLVNKDLRRQNSDTASTPDYFLPVAADTEIELRLAQVDPNGQPTMGITHTYTDSTEFYAELNNMKYDETGGKTAWDTEHYLNIWIIRNIEADLEGGGLYLGIGTLPGSLPVDQRGIVLRTDRFWSAHGWRTLTHEFGHYVCLLHPEAYDTCYNADLVSDTPIGQIELILNCEYTIVTCGNGPFGNMHMNFMSHGQVGCQNIFTEGQKARMLNCAQTQMPGLTDYYYLGVDEVSRQIIEPFPNPASENLNFQAGQNGRFSMFNVHGRTVCNGNVKVGLNKVDVSNLAIGIYLLQFQNEHSTFTTRFVKN